MHSSARFDVSIAERAGVMRRPQSFPEMRSRIHRASRKNNARDKTRFGHTYTQRRRGGLGLGLGLKARSKHVYVLGFCASRGSLKEFFGCAYASLMPSCSLRLERSSPRILSDMESAQASSLACHVLTAAHTPMECGKLWGLQPRPLDLSTT